MLAIIIYVMGFLVNIGCALVLDISLKNVSDITQDFDIRVTSAKKSL